MHALYIRIVQGFFHIIHIVVSKRLWWYVWIGGKFRKVASLSDIEGTVAAVLNEKRRIQIIAIT